MSASFGVAARTARKPHTCASCTTEIPAGSQYIRWSWASDGTAYSVQYHADCYELECELNMVNGTYGEGWMSVHDCVTNGGIEVLDGASSAVRARFGLSP
jgi:hypothetical protein